MKQQIQKKILPNKEREKSQDDNFALLFLYNAFLFFLKKKFNSARVEWFIRFYDEGDIG